jgi:hypothetical protein
MRTGSSGVAVPAGAAIWLGVASSSEVRDARPSPPARVTISSSASSSRVKAPLRPYSEVTARRTMVRMESSSSGSSSTTRELLMSSAEFTSK